MSGTGNSKRKALTALALSLVAAAALTATASGGPSPEIPYLSHGQGVAESQFQGSDDGGPMFPNGVPYGYVGRGVDSGAESAPGGVTPTNLARAVARYGPHGPLPGTALVPEAPAVAAVSASADGFDRDDVGIGFGLGLVLAMAGAIALAATRSRTRMAHS